MKVKINREIRDYAELVFFGMSLCQCAFTAAACVVACHLHQAGSCALLDRLYASIVKMSAPLGSGCSCMSYNSTCVPKVFRSDPVGLIMD